MTGALFFLPLPSRERAGVRGKRLAERETPQVRDAWLEESGSGLNGPYLRSPFVVSLVVPGADWHGITL